MVGTLRRRFGVDFLDILRRNPVDPKIQDDALAVIDILDHAFHIGPHLAVVTEGAFGDVAGFVPKDAVEWARNYAAQRVVEISRSVEDTVRGLIVSGLQRGDSVDATAEAIRSTVGLHRAWAEAVGRYYRNLVAEGTPLGRAAQMRDDYAQRLIARRAEMIARTEFIAASSNGRLEGYREMMRNGSLGPVVEKEWLTAKSEVSKRGRRVCPICKPLNHVKVRGLDATWTSGKLTSLVPPIHPSCRCSFVVRTAGETPRDRAVSGDAPPTPEERIAAVVAPRALVELSGQPEERDAFARAVEDFAADYPAAASQITFVKPYRLQGSLAEVVIGKALMPQGAVATEPFYGPQGVGIYFNPTMMRYPAHGDGALSVQLPPGPQRWYDTVTHELGHVLHADWYRIESRAYQKPFAAMSRYEVELFISSMVARTPEIEPLWRAVAGSTNMPSLYGEQNPAEWFAEIFLATRRYRNTMAIPPGWDELVAKVRQVVEQPQGELFKAGGDWPVNEWGDQAITLIVDRYDGRVDVAKKLSPGEQASVEAETARIKINREGPGSKPHPFKAAHWTHPNGHPRCLLCGASQRLPDNFTGNLTEIPFEEWPVADCPGYSPVAKVRHVATPAGVEHFHLPIGSPIVGHHHKLHRMPVTGHPVDISTRSGFFRRFTKGTPTDFEEVTLGTTYKIDEGARLRTKAMIGVDLRKRMNDPALLASLEGMDWSTVYMTEGYDPFVHMSGSHEDRLRQLWNDTVGVDEYGSREGEAKANTEGLLALRAQLRSDNVGALLTSDWVKRTIPKDSMSPGRVASLVSFIESEALSPRVVTVGSLGLLGKGDLNSSFALHDVVMAVSNTHTYNDADAATKTAIIAALSKPHTPMVHVDPQPFEAFPAGLNPEPEVKKAVLVRMFIDTWAGSSGDSNAISIALQRATQEWSKRNFGEAAGDIGSLRKYAGATTWEKSSKIGATHGVFLDHFLSATYSETQEYLAERGLTSMHLHRGMHFDALPPWLAEADAQGLTHDGKVDGGVRVLLNPASSWAAGHETADSFAGGHRVYVEFEAEIPASDVLSSSVTGLGALTENEMVVLGFPRDDEGFEWRVGGEWANSPGEGAWLVAGVKDKPAWEANGFATAAEAAPWSNAGLAPASAKEWKAAGFTPAAADDWLARHGTVETAILWKDWTLDQGPWNWPAAGFATPEQAQPWANAGAAAYEAEGMVRAGVKAEDIAKWREAFGDPAAYGNRGWVEWASSGLSVEEAKAWSEAMSPMTDDPLLAARRAQQWRADGVSLEEAAAWTKLGMQYVDNEWRTAGFGPAEAKAWIDMNIRPADARHWLDLGVTPAQVGEFRRLGLTMADLNRKTADGKTLLAKIISGESSPLEAAQLAQAINAAEEPF